MVEIWSMEDFETWLEGKPQAVSVVLATRIALRVQPMLFQAAGKMPEDRFEAAIFLPVVRSTLTSGVSFASATTPEVSEKLKGAVAAADAAAPNAAAAAPNAAAAYAVAAAAAADAYAAADAAAYAAYAAADAAAAVWAPLSSDATAIEEGTSPQVLLRPAIWPNRHLPSVIAENWKELRAYLGGGKDPTWRFWVELYESFLDGGEKNWPLLTEVALIPNEIWEEGPEAVAAEIEKIEAKYSDGVEENDDGALQLVEATPLTADVVRNTDGIYTLVPHPLSKPARYENALNKVRKSVTALRGALASNAQYARADPVLDRLETDFGQNEVDALAMHDAFLTAARGLTLLADIGEIPPIEKDLHLSNLATDLRTGVVDIRASEEEVAEAVKARANAGDPEPTDEEREAIAVVIEAEADASDPALAKTLREEKDVLLAPEGEVSREAKVEAAYKLGALTARVTALEQKEPGAFARFVTVADGTTKIIKAGAAVAGASIAVTGTTVWAWPYLRTAFDYFLRLFG